MRKTTKSPTARRLPKPAVGASLLNDHGTRAWAPASALRNLCGGVSAVTWWRWRNTLPDFPKGRVVRGRWYFPIDDVLKWWNGQPQQRQGL
jgi:hypothetical protein